MELLQLEYFLAVARLGNMTTAATSLNVAQSSVSRSIARLEADLGVPLFERNGRGIVLNDYGKTFYSHAETVMREISEGERELKELRDQHIGQVSISTCSARQINPLMIRYIEENPHVLLRQRRLTSANDIKAKLDSGFLDYALAYTPLADSEYEWKPLICERYYALVSSEHPLAERERISLSDLAQERIFINASDNPDFIEEHCLQSGFSPTFAFICDEYEILGPMVERNHGITLIATLSVYDMKKSLPMQHFSRIRTVPISDDSFKRTLGIVSRKHHYFSSAAKAFYHNLLSYFRTIELEMA